MTSKWLEVLLGVTWETKWKIQYVAHDCLELVILLPVSHLPGSDL